MSNFPAAMGSFWNKSACTSKSSGLLGNFQLLNHRFPDMPQNPDMFSECLKPLNFLYIAIFNESYIARNHTNNGI